MPKHPSVKVRNMLFSSLSENLTCILAMIYYTQNIRIMIPIQNSQHKITEAYFLTLTKKPSSLFQNHQKLKWQARFLTRRLSSSPLPASAPPSKLPQSPSQHQRYQRRQQLRALVTRAPKWWIIVLSFLIFLLLHLFYLRASSAMPGQFFSTASLPTAATTLAESLLQPAPRISSSSAAAISTSEIGGSSIFLSFQLSPRRLSSPLLRQRVKLSLVFAGLSGSGRQHGGGRQKNNGEAGSTSQETALHERISRRSSAVPTSKSTPLS